MVVVRENERIGSIVWSAMRGLRDRTIIGDEYDETDQVDGDDEAQNLRYGRVESGHSE